MAAKASAQTNGSGFNGVCMMSQFIERLYFTVAIDANDAYAAGGLPFSLQLGDLVKSQYVPLTVIIEGDNGFVYAYVNGTNPSNGKVKILTGAAAQSALTELSNGAVPAGVTGDTLSGYADFTRG